MGRINIYNALENGEKLPRKIKKHYLGRRLNKSDLRKLLASVRVVKKPHTLREHTEIFPYEFCPKCGCRQVRATGNMVPYPEHWEYFYCRRCNNRVGVIDNSPFIHALECDDFCID